ncbi:hypothetical protein Mapa_012712 [Marchantia paleacea]|nr:hypothetical protein Mapa_012712 [Marchantia paleacea]
MASAQVEPQSQTASEAENKQEQSGPTALQLENEPAEPAVQIQCYQISASQESASAEEPRKNEEPQTAGENEKQVEASQPEADMQEPQDAKLYDSSSQEQGDSASAQGGASKSPESAQLRARRLAIEAAEAQEAAQRAAKLAAEKQIQALAAAKEAVEEIHAEHEAAKAAALHEVEEVAERASKQQKLSVESSQEALQGLLQSTIETSLRQSSEPKASSAHHSSQSTNGAKVSEGQNSCGQGLDAFQSAARQFAVEANETLQNMMQSTIDKTVSEMSPPTRDQDNSLNAEQPMNPAQDSELPTGPETPTQAGPQMCTQVPVAVPAEAPAAINGTQVHTSNPNAIQTQNPFSNTPILANTETDSYQNAGNNFLGKSPEVDTFRTTPETQPTEQGPAPMQVG